jgi:hypothetical protein
MRAEVKRRLRGPARAARLRRREGPARRRRHRHRREELLRAHQAAASAASTSRACPARTSPPSPTPARSRSPHPRRRPRRAHRPHAVQHVDRRHPAPPLRRALRDARDSCAWSPPTATGSPRPSARSRHEGRGSKLLIPAKAIHELKRLVDEVRAEKNDGTARPLTMGIGAASSQGPVFFQRDGMTLSSKLVDAAFPSYEQVIPTADRPHGALNSRRPSSTPCARCPSWPPTAPAA